MESIQILRKYADVCRKCKDFETRWITEKSEGLTDAGLYRISESIRAFVYLILSSQAYMRSSIIANPVSALTAHSAFLNNFENIVNHRHPGRYQKISRHSQLHI